MPAISGKVYIKRIDDRKPDIWYAGQKITGQLSGHPAFRGVIKSQAALYDLQLARTADMIFASPKTGDPVGLSYMEPRTKEDLAKRRKMTQIWAEETCGMLGRSPDYMNTVMMAFAAAADVFDLQGTKYRDNMKALFEQARENDWSFTHTFIFPQTNRSSFYVENSDGVIAAQPVKKNDEGLVIQGARLLATQGGLTDELLVLPPGGRISQPELAYGFSIPTNTPGLRFICRESYALGDDPFNYPLNSRFEEMDSIVVFDDVVVPWDRVFFYENPMVAEFLYQDSGFSTIVPHQVLSRRVKKIEFILGLAELLVETISISQYQHIHQKMGDIIVGLESLKGLLIRSEIEALPDRQGTMLPAPEPLKAANSLFPKFYSSLTEMFQQIGASGLASLPVKKDFESELKEELDRYLQASARDAEDRVKIFRLAWDTFMSSFGTRETLYERFFFGDPIRLVTSLYHSYPTKTYSQRVKDFLNIQ